MTFQPPPPPPGENPPPPPPPPPPGQWGPPPGGGGGRPAFDPKSVNPLDWGILGAGFLIFIFSFVSYYTYDGKGDASGYSYNQSAWNGFFGWFAMLLALAGSVAVALDLFMPQFKMPWPNRLVGLGLYAVATLSVILALFVVPDYAGGGPGYDKFVDEGHGFGYWLSLILIIAGLVMSLMRLQQTGGKLPGPLANMPNIGAKGPQGGIGGQQNPPQPPPPPPPGYGQPPGP